MLQQGKPLDGGGVAWVQLTLQFSRPHVHHRGVFVIASNENVPLAPSEAMTAPRAKRKPSAQLSLPTLVGPSSHTPSHALGLPRG
jgi:hypothetical protein